MSCQWIMIAGPYSSGAADQAARAANLRVLNQAAVAVLDKGHVPVIGVNLALPVIEAAGADAYERIMLPLSLALAERRDACLRIGEPSTGADQEAARFRARGLPVCFALDEVPAA